jgi:hypothetical protein
MRIVSALLPLAIAIAAVSGLAWFLLTRGWAAGPWLLALLLFAHGWVHLVFLFPQPQPAEVSADGLAYPFDMERSWLIARLGVEAGLVRILGIILMAIVFATATLAALATIGILVPAGWWAGLVITSAVASMTMLTVFFAPGLLLGYAIDIALLWLVLGAVWSPAAPT